MATRNISQPLTGESCSADAPAISTRRRATRSRLLDAVREVIAAKGVHGASVEEICEVAGFTRGAFYSNYADKDELVLDLVRREQTRIFDQVDGRTAADGLDATVDAVLAAWQPDLDYHLVHSEITLHALRTPEFAPIARAAEDAFRTRIVTIVSQGLDHLGLEPVGDVNDLAECICALTERSIRSAVLSGETDLLRLARRALPPILRSLTQPRTTAPLTDDLIA